MSCSDNFGVPSWWCRVRAVWFRHIRVYTSNLWSNALPPFLEPLIFLAGLGIGLGAYVEDVGQINYILFLASGVIMTSSMYTAAFECSYGTFIRLEFDKVYDGMLGAPISPADLIIGEILFAGSKSTFFALAVLVVTWLLGIITSPWSIGAVLVGFLCGIMFATLSLWITAWVKNINHFNFYYTGFLSPMFFFSGIVFPLESLPQYARWGAETLPLTHVVRIARAFCIPEQFGWYLLIDLLYCLLMILVTGRLAIRSLRKRMID